MNHLILFQTKSVLDESSDWQEQSVLIDRTEGYGRQTSITFVNNSNLFLSRDGNVNSQNSQSQ